MSINPSIAVVILNWNGVSLLEKYLPSVVSNNIDNCTIYLADNASTDTSIDFVRRNYPEIKVIKNDTNYGFAEGYNIATKNIKSDYLILLNSDVEVTANWIQPVIEMMEKDHSIAAAQPKIISYLNKEYFEYAGASGGFIDRFGYPFCRGRIFDVVEKDNNQYNSEIEIFWASGAAFFIRNKLFVEAGGFDKDFFAHMEEIDLCWRLKNMGYKIKASAASTVYHLGGGTLAETSPHKTYLNFRNSLFTLRKNLPFHNAFGIILLRHFLDLLAWVKFIFEGKWKHSFAINRAHYDFLISQGTWYKKRKELLKLFKNPNLTGLYQRSIVFDFFARKKKKYSDLNRRDFL